MHESPFICPLLNMTAKASSAVLATTLASTDDTKEEEPSRGMALGKLSCHCHQMQLLSTIEFPPQDTSSSSPL